MMEIDLTEEDEIKDVIVKEEYILDDDISDSETTAQEVKTEEDSKCWQEESMQFQSTSSDAQQDSKDFLQFEITELDELGPDKKPREKRLKCQVCDRKFPESKYYDHLRSHTERAKFQCDICLKTFVSGISKWKHMTNTHECDICGEIFSKRKDRTEHILEDHKGIESKNLRPSDIKPFRCDKCGKSFSYECHYMQHISSTIDCTRQLICPICSQECKTQSTLTNHIKTHSTDKPFVCTMCDKAFKMKSHLESHVSTHMQKSLMCPYCPKRFKVQKAVEDHIKNRHHGLPPNPNDPVICCTICKKIYKSLSALMEHVRIHPKRKPYECEFCGKRMTCSYYKKKHIELAHSTEMYRELPEPPVKEEEVEDEEQEEIL
ncbi:zinc finger protein 26-like [Lutzomyia longipalpis]|uniref:zinc finger protein 26-like n=1 Tax=Lutzomyia longipalpis TaxID=7200 RepID=UPI002483C92F|nr:zinc finger protein 26-like [Lutzomyia longipalpis]XP_055680469.1 zinc finger protein 26-like [Lutzomyia longipalpis]XP_055680470.1 zinc finger protein 26-like [Lutzomyia longipalpis]